MYVKLNNKLYGILGILKIKYHFIENNSEHLLNESNVVEKSVLKWLWTSSLFLIYSQNCRKRVALNNLFWLDLNVIFPVCDLQKIDDSISRQNGLTEWLQSSLIKMWKKYSFSKSFFLLPF
jgi:hypothetical protein